MNSMSSQERITRRMCCRTVEWDLLGQHYGAPIYHLLGGYANLAAACLARAGDLSPQPPSSRLRIERRDRCIARRQSLKYLSGGRNPPELQREVLERRRMEIR